MNRLSFALRSYIVAFLAALLMELFFFSNAKAEYFLDGEKYSGVSLGLLFVDSISDISLSNKSAIYIGAGQAPAIPALTSSASPSISGLNWIFNGYVGMVDDLDIAYEVSVNWIGNTFSGDEGNDFSFESIGIYFDIGYDFYSYCILNTNTSFFGKIGVGLINLYNMTYTHNIAGVVGANSFNNTIGGLYDASSFGWSMRGTIGGRVPISDCTSISLSVAILWLTSIGNIATGSTPVTTDTLFFPRGGWTIGNDDISILTGLVTIGAEMLVW